MKNLTGHALWLALGLAAALPSAAMAQTTPGGAAMPGMAMPGMDMAAATATGKAVRVGALELSAGAAKAMLPGQPVGGGYVTIRNGGTSDDRLISVTSPAAGKVELHDMAMQGQVMTMRRLDGGIAIPAGKTVSLSPGGMHMMFMDLTRPFKAGDQIRTVLTFEKAGSVEIVLDVAKMGGMPSKP